jgi:hypothetical protein
MPIGDRLDVVQTELMATGLYYRVHPTLHPTHGVRDARGHHFAARVNRPQAYRSAGDAEDGHRV